MTQFVELQRNMKSFESNDIKVFALSYDSQDILRGFAEKHGIIYYLLSDEGSHVIRDFGIFNSDVPEDSDFYDIPRPGSYMIGNDGLVFEKSFFTGHRKRESINDMLQETFQASDVETGKIEVASTDDLVVRAYFASPTIRESQINVLTVEIAVAKGLHVNGRPWPDKYTPLEITIDGGTAVVLDPIAYPKPEEMEIKAVGEKLPVHSGRFAVKAYCMGTREGEAGLTKIVATLRYQACDDEACYLPQTVTIPLSLEFLAHVE